MVKLVYTFLLIFICNILVAQPSHFVYLQTENKQPFYVKLNNNIYSSQASGYVIIPKLVDGNYSMVIGFPKNEWPELSVACSISDNDAGYLLKNFKENGWGLFNLQTLEVLMAANIAQITTETVQNKTDAFSNMLADVVDDPTIKQVSAVKAEPKILSVVAKDSTEIKTQQPDLASGISTVTKSSEKVLDSGTIVVYIDKQGLSADTITILLPNEVQVTEIAKPAIDTSAIAQLEKAASQTRFLDIEVKNTGDSVVKENIPILKDSVTNIPPDVNKKADEGGFVLITNTKCHNVAKKSDLEKLRKKMNSAKDLDGMLGVAKKYFKEKCYSTEQIRSLCDMFLSDEDRYRFLDAAYPYVSDNDKFSTLEDLLKDQYYIKRFKAMIVQ